MDSSRFNGFDIFEIYKRYHEITSVSYGSVAEGGITDEESEKVKLSREALSQLLKEVELSVHTRGSIFDEVLKLMSRLDLTVDFSEFSHLYNFVFFICRENGQKNITVSRAIMAWRLVLAGRFRLLNQWCNFVEENQRHNISEDTWRQVLAFSRCVHENLEGYDPEGAWPVLVDEFVEHMYRITGTNDNPNVVCDCGDSESQLFEEPLPGLKTFPGLKRKLNEDFEGHEPQFAGSHSGYKLPWGCKRSQIFASEGKLKLDSNPPGNGTDDCMGIVKHNVQMGRSKSHCAVEGCLSKGFAGLFSGRSCLQFGRKRRVSFT